jgi:folate-binding protein YgfZ
VTGVDATAFLQGQLITNLHRLNPQRGNLSAWCTPQGRVAFQFHLIPVVEGYLLLVPESEAARLLQRLKMYVLRAKVTLEDASAQCGVLGLSVPGGREKPAAVSALVPVRHTISRLNDAVGALCIDDSARFLLYGDGAALLAWWQASALPGIGSAAWRLLDIEQGYAEITGASANAFLPQQLNLDLVDALAFDKGCYPGQEIIARLKYRGEVKSRLLRGRSSGPVATGAKLTSRSASHTAGQVLSTVTLPSQESRFLAVVELNALQEPPLLDHTPALALQFEPPPYWHL